jgi:phage gp29-like protein
MATRDVTFYISFLNALPNPDPILKKTGNRIETYRDLEADWELFSAVELIHSGLKELEWEMKPNDAPTEQVEWIESLVKQWDPYHIMTQCIEARNYGYQPFELVWKSGKTWYIDQIIEKPQEWFNYSTDNELQFISKEHPTGKVIGNPYKFIVARNRPTYANPYGQSHYSRCFWPVTFKKGGFTFFIKFLEKYGMPWVVGKQPRNTGDPETNKFLQELHQMVQDAVAVIPDDSSVDLKDASSRGSSSAVYMDFIKYLDRVINKVILSNELSMGTSEGGSDIRGDAGQNMQVSQQVIKSVAEMAEKVINTAIAMVWEKNFTTPVPEASIFRPKDVQKPRAERDEIMSRQGVRFTKKYYKDNFALADDDFELVEPKPTTDTPNNDSVTVEASEAFNQPTWYASFKDRMLEVSKSIQFEELDSIEQNSIKALEELDKLIEASAGDSTVEITQQMMANYLQPIFELVAESESFADLEESLFELYPQMDSSAIQERLGKAYFIADILGRITENENTEIDE